MLLSLSFSVTTVYWSGIIFGVRRTLLFDWIRLMDSVVGTSGWGCGYVFLAYFALTGWQVVFIFGGGRGRGRGRRRRGMRGWTGRMSVHVTVIRNVSSSPIRFCLTGRKWKKNLLTYVVRGRSQITWCNFSRFFTTYLPVVINSYILATTYST